MTLAGVVKEDLACPGSSLPEKKKKKTTSAKLQAASLTMVQGSCRINIERYIMEKDKNQTVTDGLYILQGSLNRIADALEEVLRLVKEDQERSRKYMEEKKDE